MGRKVFLSFLGIGPQDGYKKVVYSINGQELSETKFVQAAEIKYHGQDFFDKIIIACTKTSKDKYFNELNNALKGSAEEIEISENLDPASQWEGFEKIIGKFLPNDELYLDLTHGFRSVPIMFSIAVNFLQQIKNIELKAAYYGAHDQGNRIIDFKDFFALNLWADAVSRLVENADAKKLAAVASGNESFQIADLNDDKMIESFNKLTDSIRNVDVNNISGIASDAIKMVKAKQAAASETEKLLLDMVIEKFSLLSTEEPLSGQYDEEYFRVQIEIIKVLIEHKLFMQAFTAMRECVGSIGLIGFENVKFSNGDGRKKRNYADVFVNMLQFDEEKWVFNEQQLIFVDKLKPFYYKLQKNGVESKLRIFVKEMINLRNSFDHAWTSRQKSDDDINSKAFNYFEILKKSIEMIFKKQD